MPAHTTHVTLKFEKKAQETHKLGPGYHLLYAAQSYISNYPEGNFGRNQLLDGSIGLPPLSHTKTNDLHVSIGTSLHQKFLLAPLLQSTVHHLSGLSSRAHL